tara:strand:- start:859 stop:2064 length:1206 start_codon:yes stop_codon:yes gene_type:complete
MTSINDLQNDHKNARKRTDRSSKLIAESLSKFGAARSIVIDENNRILAGNGTIAGAKAAGIKNLKIIETDGKEIIAVKRTGLSEDEKIGLALADNRTSDLSEWDVNMLEELSKEHDLEPWFDNDDLKELLGEVEEIPAEGLTDPDEVPEVPEEPVTKEGDLYILGNHRLLCGDSTNIKNVEKLMDSKKADMVFTDPPYGVNVKGGAKSSNLIAGDLTQVAIPFSFDLAVERATKNDARFYFCGSEGNISLYSKLFDRFLHQLPRHLIWMKNGFVMRPNNYHNQYEIIFFGYKPKGGGLNHWYSGRTEAEASDIWVIKRDPSKGYLHPTQKPIELPERAIKNSSPLNGLIYEPFGGSGSTLIACQKNNRCCYSMELDPKYCDVIVKRWEDFTGKTAKRVSSS